MTRFPDTTVTDDGTMFYRRRNGQYGNEPYAMRFQADRPLSDDEVTHFAQAAGYAWAAEVRGENLGDPVRDGEDAFYLSADSTKTRSDDLGRALERFENTVSVYVQDGSPVRKTNRKGPGTKGTRLVEGIPNLRFALYYDSVVDETGAASA